MVESEMSAKVLQAAQAVVKVNGQTLSGRITSSRVAVQTITKLTCHACEYRAKSEAEFEVHALLCTQTTRPKALSIYDELSEMQLDISAKLEKQMFKSMFPDIHDATAVLTGIAAQLGAEARRKDETDDELRKRLKAVLTGKP
jgi:hypothetical protein